MLWLVSLALLVLVGCRSHPEIPVNDEQSLVMESSLLAAGISAESPSFRHLIFNLQHPQRFITKGKNPLPFIIVFTGMTPEAGDASSGKATQRYHSRTFGGHAVRQRQFSGGAQSQTLSIFVRGES